ncbi:hypothetical protein KPATCC21470_6626 [Kitasatospora purpeofusca]
MVSAVGQVSESGWHPSGSSWFVLPHHRCTAAVRTVVRTART